MSERDHGTEQVTRHAWKLDEQTRRKIYEILNHRSGRLSVIYEWVMLSYIVLSIIPLMFRDQELVPRIIETYAVIFFILDYILRWITADFRLKKGNWSFVLYPITAWAIIDLLSILPELQILDDGFTALRITRLLRVMRLLKIFHFTNKFDMLGRAIRRERKILVTVMLIAVFYVFITALIMFNVEPRIDPRTGNVTFASFFDALYWATVTLTTVGYGDVIPVTSFGRLVSMVSSLFGMAIIALPSGVITASYLDELRRIREKKEKEKERLREQQRQESSEEGSNQKE